MNTVLNVSSGLCQKAQFIAFKLLCFYYKTVNVRFWLSGSKLNHTVIILVRSMHETNLARQCFVQPSLKEKLCLPHCPCCLSKNYLSISSINFATRESVRTLWPLYGAVLVWRCLTLNHRHGCVKNEQHEHHYLSSLCTVTVIKVEIRTTLRPTKDFQAVCQKF